MKKQTCIICGKPLNDAIVINGRGICSICEKRLMNLQPGNDFYEHYKECIKKIIFHARGAEDSCQNYHL